MNQVAHIKSQYKKVKKESAKTKAKRFAKAGLDIYFGISETDKQFLAESLHQALLLNKKEGVGISLCVPIFDITKIDLDTLIIEGTTNEALAKRTGKQIKPHKASLADLYNHYGMAYLITENHEMLNVNLKVKEVEKEVIKEVKTVQTSATGIKPKEIKKAIDNTLHAMSKKWQRDVVESVLGELSKQLKL